jgi:hypothetical protein
MNEEQLAAKDANVGALVAMKRALLVSIAARLSGDTRVGQLQLECVAPPSCALDLRIGAFVLTLSTS